MAKKLKLITEAESANFDLQFITEQDNRTSEKKLYVMGRYIMMNERNKNRRRYIEEEMLPAIQIFEENYINRNRAGGTLNHESSADIDLGKLCHKIVSLKRDEENPNFFIGKSLVLSTPSGKILESLIRDEMTFGMSTRALGQIVEESDGHAVKSPILISVDAVYDPSIGGGGSLNDKTTGFVNGILENKEYIIGDNGDIAEAFDRFEKSIAKYPTHHKDQIREHIIKKFSNLLKEISRA